MGKIIRSSSPKKLVAQTRFSRDTNKCLFVAVALLAGCGQLGRLFLVASIQHTLARPVIGFVTLPMHVPLFDNDPIWGFLICGCIDGANAKRFFAATDKNIAPRQDPAFMKGAFTKRRGIRSRPFKSRYQLSNGVSYLCRAKCDNKTLNVLLTVSRLICRMRGRECESEVDLHHLPSFLPSAPYITCSWNF